MMKSGDKTIFKSKRYPLVFATIVAFASVLSAAVSTFAWFQAEAQVQIQTTSSYATVTVSKPDDAKFYYFKGNGNPATPSTYVGYSKSDATVGTTTNTVNTTAGTVTTGELSSGVAITFASTFQEITGTGNFTAAKCFDFSRMRPGCYYTYCVSYATSAAMTLSLGEFTQIVDGDDCTPKRYLVTNTPGTTPLSLAQIINSMSYSVAYSDATALNTSTLNYVKKTLGVGSLAVTGDRITYNGATGAGTSNAFTLHSKASDSSATYYIFFTVYMESDKTNALIFNSKSGSGSSETYNYAISSSGSYAPYDGLSVQVSSISLT